MIHSSVLIFGNFEIDDSSRVDAYCVLSGNIKIGKNVHIGAGTHLFGDIEIEDYCGISGGCSLYSKSDDYTEGHLTNPTIPEILRKVNSKKIILRKHAIIGTRSVVMPGVEIGVGASVGALSFVNKSVPSYLIVSGNPLKKVGTRNKDRLEEYEKLHKTGNYQNLAR